uniref:Amino-acid acetyltransferase n=1 Tax=Candidatus Kentrum eta TaxID=2126337 RepID=A0A450UHL7_9GAMM|nr:MAG: N-acetylglutamate synthase [Candidatus Kentron sp. H]VFJ93073.1 MAG: N-acetylglutamate synthase [Candidatus Kentron sp. H]VFJ99921.1 MAG: N-acetylglutamate synthase [Candidatus Kentron sp. H]
MTRSKYGNGQDMVPQDIIPWFRGAAPYIKSQRGNIFVVYFSGDVIADSAKFPGLIADFALLHSLGVKLVLVYGAHPQIEQRLEARGVSARYANGFRITDETTLAAVKEAVTATRLDIESRLSTEPVNAPTANTTGGNNTRIRVASGNFMTGRPIGVRDGVDFGYTGEVRRIDVPAIRALLAGGHIVLIPPLGFSPTGEVFNLSALDVAAGVATSLAVAKLLLLDGKNLSGTPEDRIPRQITLSQAKSLLTEYREGDNRDNRRNLACAARGLYRQLERAVQVCQSGVPRTHLIDHRIDGALLLEIYTRDGVGTMVCGDAYDTLRGATSDDIAGIIKLITPLEERGILVRRSREKLEAEIDRFLVMERDGAIIACAAAYPCVDERRTEVKILELACLAVHQDYRGSDCGNALLEAIEKSAHAKGATQLFVLTTHTEHWFLEHGFSRATLNDLPRTRRGMYNENRNAKVLIKAL